MPGPDRRYQYGRTFVSFPARPKKQILHRVVNGASLRYVRLGDSVTVFDGPRQLPLTPEAVRRILAVWPHDDEQADLIDWWD